MKTRILGLGAMLIIALVTTTGAYGEGPDEALVETPDVVEPAPLAELVDDAAPEVDVDVDVDVEPSDAKPETQWEDPADRYTCTPSRASSGALAEEMQAFVARQRDATLVLEAKRAEIEELKIALTKEAERLEAAIAATVERERKDTEENADKNAKAAARAREESEASLAKMVGKMEASSAATLLQSLEESLASSLLKRMSAARAGAALSAMQPQKAAQLAAVAAKGKK